MGISWQSLHADHCPYGRSHLWTIVRQRFTRLGNVANAVFGSNPLFHDWWLLDVAKSQGSRLVGLVWRPNDSESQNVVRRGRFGVASIYNAFLDTDIPRHKLFYLFGSFYFCLFLVIAFSLMHRPGRILGWTA